jgi:hypothetical protein
MTKFIILAYKFNNIGEADFRLKELPYIIQDSIFDNFNDACDFLWNYIYDT